MISLIPYSTPTTTRLFMVAKLLYSRFFYCLFIKSSQVSQFSPERYNQSMLGLTQQKLILAFLSFTQYFYLLHSVNALISVQKFIWLVVLLLILKLYLSSISVILHRKRREGIPMSMFAIKC